VRLLLPHRAQGPERPQGAERPRERGDGVLKLLRRAVARAPPPQPPRPGRPASTSRTPIAVTVCVRKGNL
jgi:hypothetical protein